MPTTATIILRTLKIALLTTVGSLLLGYPLAYFLARTRERLARRADVPRHRAR